MKLLRIQLGLFVVAAVAFSWASTATAGAPKRNYPYFELEGTVLGFKYYHNWRSYYWRDDITMLVRDKNGKQWRIISREPTPWNNLRFGTTYTKLKVDWKNQPKVKIIGVQAIDRIPVEFYNLKLDKKNTATAFIVRVWDEKQKTWRDYFINNWFHRWGTETDVKILPHYANNDPNYTVYGYLRSIAAPFDVKGQKLINKSLPLYNGIIYHGRIAKAKNNLGYEVRLLHLVGRNKKTARYEVFYGDPSELIRLDQRKPKSES